MYECTCHGCVQQRKDNIIMLQTRCCSNDSPQDEKTVNREEGIIHSLERKPVTNAHCYAQIIYKIITIDTWNTYANTWDLAVFGNTILSFNLFIFNSDLYVKCIVFRFIVCSLFDTVQHLSRSHYTFSSLIQWIKTQQTLQQEPLPYHVMKKINDNIIIIYY